MAGKASGNTSKKHSGLRGWMETLAEVAIIVLVAFALCWPLKIRGISMEPTLYSGDRVCISRVTALLGWIERGDLIVCKIEENGYTEDIIKRVVGLPGEEIVIAEGVVYVNGAALAEPYANGVTAGALSVTLAQGEYFVMGDSRETSVDSRALGAVSVSGKVLFRFYPFSQINGY